MIPVILSGGSGTRLWPVSRAKLPKQFCELFEQSLHSATIKRLTPLGCPWIITSQGLRDLTLRDAKAYGIPANHVLFEPLSRNTAPAIALICHVLNNQNQGESVIGIFPADHLIEKEKDFEAALKLAATVASSGKVVTLGIKPTEAATGYGYIQISAAGQQGTSGLESYQVTKFHEKPSLEKATEFLNAGNFFWNAGIFVFRVDAMISAFKAFQPKMWELVSLIKPDCSNIKEVFEKLENISIDYAIMEKLSSDQLACVPCDVGWNDVGSWDAIAEILGTDSNKKVEIKAKNNFVHSALDKKYAFIDIDDLVVVDTEDALLIAKKGSSQAVKDVVDTLKASNPVLTKDHTFELRPWGQYEILRDEKHFKSKVIQVLPHEQISYQSHAKREEHWLVTRGTGEVILNDQVIPVKTGTYINIPLGAKHRIRNTSSEIVEFVEVQLGSYFGEDDIVRYQDDYQRA